MRSRTGSAATRAPLTVDYDGTQIPVDTGFIVFNEKNYPRTLGHVPPSERAGPEERHDVRRVDPRRLAGMGRAATPMRCSRQRRNLLRPKFGMLIRDVFRFNAQRRRRWWNVIRN